MTKGTVYNVFSKIYKIFKTYSIINVSFFLLVLLEVILAWVSELIFHGSILIITMLFLEYFLFKITYYHICFYITFFFCFIVKCIHKKQIKPMVFDLLIIILGTLFNSYCIMNERAWSEVLSW